MINAIKWTATCILIIGTFFSSIGVYPIGPMITSVGGILWLYVSIIWREFSLIVTNTIMTGVCIGGLIFNYFKG
jgi:hypothetical protein